MREDRNRSSRWQAVLEQMFEELRSGSPRAEGYWAQQLAFGPVFFSAVLLAVRKGALASDDLALLRELVPLALALLGALPDESDGDPARLLLLARRQARALELGRRRLLVRLAAHLGLEVASPPYEPVPERLRRPHELIGWDPPESKPVQQEDQEWREEAAEAREMAQKQGIGQEVIDRAVHAIRHDR